MTSTGITTAGFIRSRVGGLPRPFWVLFGGTLVNRLGTMVEPFIGIYLTQARGMPVTAAGLVMTVFGLGSLFSQPLAGWLTDRVGRRATLSGGMVATAVTMLALGYATNLAGICAAMFVLGVVIDAYRPASQALVADLVRPEDRPRAYGLLFWAINLGYSVSMVAGGWLARSGFTLLFWIDAFTCLVFGLLVWRAVPETRRAAREGKEAGGFRDVLRDRVMVAYALTCLMFYVVYAQSYTTLPLAMTAQGLPTSSYGMAMAVNGLLIVLIQPFSTVWLARFEPSRVLATGYAIAGVGFMLTAVMSTTAGHATAVAVWTLGEIVTAGIHGTIVAALAPAHLRGRYSGLYGLSWSAAGLLAPLIGTRLLAVGPEVLWPVMGGLALLAAAAQLSLTRAIRARQAA
ncbi:MDR family MFS transporter [Thermobispora bispora]|nr:MFS transporter [Thermobispora bispora]MDI9581883.1 MFS transporter [Thermobispora sp.]